MIVSLISFKIIILIIVIAGFIYLVRIYQDIILYQNGTEFEKAIHQNPHGYRSPADLKLKFKDLYIKTKDSIMLHGWLILTNDSHKKPTVVFYHENAGNIGYRLGLIKNYIKIVDVNIIIVAYRGYSYSEGIPSEYGLKIDGISILNHVFKLKEIDQNNIFVHGSSLGGAVSIYTTHYNSNLLSKKNEIKGLIVQNTFTSISNMVDHVFPVFKYLKPFLLKNYWENDLLIGNLNIPILFLSSAKDEIVPNYMMQQLYNSCKSETKEFINLSESTHNDSYIADKKLYFSSIKNFISKYLN